MGKVGLAEKGPKCQAGIKFKDVKEKAPMLLLLLLLPILFTGGKRQ